MRLAVLLAIPRAEPLHHDSGGNHLDSAIDAVFTEHFSQCVTRCDHSIAKIAVADSKIGDESLKSIRVVQNIVGVLLVERMVCEYRRQVTRRSNPQRGVT